MDIVQIEDVTTGSIAKIAPQLGFNLFSFQPRIRGESWEVLWQDPAFTTGTTRPSRSGIPLLFPFPGRLRGRTLKLNGKTFEFDVTDPLGNTIHGFVYTRAWRVVSHSANSVTGEFQASLDDPTILARWPSDFRIRATYTLAAGKLLGTYEISNPGESRLPWGLGTHPYFRVSLGSPPHENAIVTFPVTERWELQDMLPTGERSQLPEADRFAQGVPFAGLQLDDVFTGLAKNSGEFYGSVYDPTTRRRTTIRFGEPFGECVVFVPPHREAICIEPYSCVSNAYELRERGIPTGLQDLAPGGTYVTSVEILAEQQDS